jgi:hypothetical protein
MTIVLPSISVLILLAAVWVVLHVDEVSKIVGYAASGVAVIWHAADRTAVKYRVEGDVNSSVDALAKNSPDGVFEGKLKIKWVNAKDATALIKDDGEVLVCLRRSAHHEENVANALMMYMPKAVAPRARRYIARGTMRAVDLVLAKSLLVESTLGAGYLQVFYDQHLEPALEGDEILKRKVERTDAVEINGWLTRIFLHELKAFGDRIYPSEGHARYALEADRFHSWLYALASRPAGARRPLAFKGELLRVGMIMVAKRMKLEREGLAPYLRWFDIYMNEMKVDTIYVVGSDDTIESVKEVIAAIADDPRVDATTEYEYSHRRQFRARIAPRQRAICAVVQRKAEAPLHVAAPEVATSPGAEIAVLSADSSSLAFREIEGLRPDEPGLEELIEAATDDDVEAVRNMAESVGDVDHAEQETVDEDTAEDALAEPPESMPSRREVEAFILTWIQDRAAQERPAYVSALGFALRRRFPGSQPLHERLGFARITDFLRTVDGLQLGAPGPQMTVELAESREPVQVASDEVRSFVVAWVQRQERLQRQAFLSSLGFALRKRFPGEASVYDVLGYPTLRALIESMDGLYLEGPRDRALVGLGVRPLAEGRVPRA